MNKKFVLLAVFLLACQILPSGERATAPLQPAEVEAQPASTPTPPPPDAGRTLHQAWQAVVSQAQVWAADVQMAGRWSCVDTPVAAGTCKYWEGSAVSIEKNDYASIVIDRDNIRFQPGGAPPGDLLQASYSLDIVDSPQAVQAARTLLEGQGQQNLQLKGITLAPGNTYTGVCNEESDEPFYYVSFADAPTVCVDAYTGEASR